MYRIKRILGNVAAVHLHPGAEALVAGMTQIHPEPGGCCDQDPYCEMLHGERYYLRVWRNTGGRIYRERIQTVIGGIYEATLFICLEDSNGTPVPGTVWEHDQMKAIIMLPVQPGQPEDAAIQTDGAGINLPSDGRAASAGEPSSV